ncbi:unnamed protein product [Prorocentrum cordatum]|uniref:Apple domain-containing protein n=1 Tax=Prorocentrum cordatum TaxID=2364126 RepID=A0ABN9XWY2_9DINO|nr:unnamed protein product [Polarella glacialis]
MANGCRLPPLPLLWFHTVPCFLLSVASGMSAEHPLEWVNPLAGAAGGQKAGQHHSAGNTLPLVARPWGFNHWAPVSTLDATSWWFDSTADTFHGIRCTHQPSPWIGDYAWFMLRPFLGWTSDEWLGFTSYQTAGAIRPYLIDITAGPYGVRTEFAPSEHGAVLRVTFPPSVPTDERRVCAWVPLGSGKDDEDEKRAKKTGTPTGECRGVGSGVVELTSRKYAQGVPEDADFAFFARLEAPGLRVQEIEEKAPDCFEHGIKYLRKDDGKMNMDKHPRSSESSAANCQARCARSEGCAFFTWWPDGGCHLLDARIKKEKGLGLFSGPARCPKAPDKGTPKVKRNCCFLLGDAEQALHALTSEVAGLSLEEVAAEGQRSWEEQLLQVQVLDAGPASRTTAWRLEVFYTSLYLGGVTDNGFWDTYRTVYPFLALAYPERLGELLEGWLNAYRQGGWLPKWASPGYRDSMTGTFADVVLADAILKNISGFDHSVAWEAMKKDSYQESGPKDSTRGKHGLSIYSEQGYIPVDAGIPEACSRTLDFAYADAAVSAAGRHFGSLFDPDQKLMGRRLKSGSFNAEAAGVWGNGFTEGSAWHHSFPAFNVSALAELHGGGEMLLQRLWDLLAAPSFFEVGSYKGEIHEMREMRMMSMGQYAHNNQPGHHLLYLFAMLGDHNVTAQLVRQVLTRGYFMEGYSGDEDNGEMGAWFVLSALGLYAAATGTTDEYVLGAVPLFPRTLLRSLDVTVEAPSAAEESPAVLQVLWRSAPLARPAVRYASLRLGGVLHWVSPGDAKYSVVASRLRGALHGAMRRAKQLERAVASAPAPQPEQVPGAGPGPTPRLLAVLPALALGSFCCQQWRARGEGEEKGE